ncbi:MAG: RNA polymerase sigma factor [Anaerocolumna sp.]
MNSDKILYCYFCKGDISAFEKLVIRHRYNLVYFLMQYLKNYHNAEDIAQEVFAYIFLNPKKYSDQYEFKTYLFMLGKRRAIDFIRKNSRYQSVSIDDTEIEDIHSLEEIIYQKQETHLLKEALGEIKPQYRQVLLLTYIYGFSMADTAVIMDKSVGAIKVLSHRAKDKLRQILERRKAYEI